MKTKKNIFGNKRTALLPAFLFFFCSAFLSASGLPGTPESWRPSPESAPVFTRGEVLIFPCEFPGETDRHYWDFPLESDWSAHSGVRISYQMPRPQSFRALTLYVKSGDGWYSATLPAGEGVRTVFLPFDAFEELDQPGGWQTVQGLRLSPWRGDGESGELRLYQLEPEPSRIAVIAPDDKSSLNPEEAAFGRAQAAWVENLLQEMSLPVERFEDAEAPAKELERFDLLILPYNAYPSRELLSALKRYREQGGRLLVFYSASPELAGICGVSLRRYLGSESEREWNRISFRDEQWRGPVDVLFPSRNILPAVPSAEGGVLGEWRNADGRLRKEPAVVRSGHAVWVSAVMPRDSSLAMKQTLVALADRLVPELRLPESVARGELQQLQRSGLLPEEEEAPAGVTGLLEAGQGFEAWNRVAALHQRLNARAAGKFDLPAFARRGIWDATGAGLDGQGLEERIRLLEEAGMTDYFLWVPRESGTPIRVLRAAENRVAVHAWHICWNLSGHSPVARRRYERDGRLQITEDGGISSWLCPSHPENQKLELRRIEALAGAKGVRGVHLDYLRWQDNAPCACLNCKRAFADWLNRTPRWPEALREGPQHDDFLSWRALQIDQFVKKVSNVMHARHPELELSAAVWPSVDWVVNGVGQNWTHWVKKGWIDFVVPMNYTENTQTFNDWMDSQRRALGKKAMIFAGIGYDSSESRLSPLQVLRQLSAAGDRGAEGFVLFQFNAAFASELAPLLNRAYGPGDKR